MVGILFLIFIVLPIVFLAAIFGVWTFIGWFILLYVIATLVAIMFNKD